MVVELWYKTRMSKDVIVKRLSMTAENGGGSRFILHNWKEQEGGC